MIIEFMRLFDRWVPDSLKFNIKELYYALEYNRLNLFREYETFSQVEVETNAHCNNRCNTCPNISGGKPEAYMNDELFKELLDQLSSMGFKGRFSPVFYNEPLLDDRLVELMRATRERLPEAELIIYTNGSLLTQESIEDLINAGVDGIIVSQYEGNLEKDGHVRGLIDQLPEELRQHIRYRVVTDDSPLFNRGGLVEVKNPVRKRFCFKSSNDAIVDHLGNVVLCSNDYHCADIFGNIGEEHIKDIWNRPVFREVRGRLRKGKFGESLELCQYCTGMKQSLLV